MATAELCYGIEVIPDLSLDKYSSLEGSGVEGVLNKHLAFLRQWNRKGVLSGTSIHLFYFFDGRDKKGDYSFGEKGNKLEILFLIRGDEEKLYSVPELVVASPLTEYFHFSATCLDDFLSRYNFTEKVFSACSTLKKKEVLIQSSLDLAHESANYYTVPQWEINAEGRLYNMYKLMESLDQRLLYRIDLYPVEKSDQIRSALRQPMAVLRERQYMKAGIGSQRDYEADNVLKSYQDLFGQVDSSPHFITNVFVFGEGEEDTAVVLDSAGAEALLKGSYDIGTFQGIFGPRTFLDFQREAVDKSPLYDRERGMILKQGSPGMIACQEFSEKYALNFLPTLMSLEEAASFFRFPTLYEGEVIQKRKETAPRAIPTHIITCRSATCSFESEQFADRIPENFTCPECGGIDCKVEPNRLFLGRDDNGYDVYFPLKNLEKHAFISGVPGSGKTNTMLHITSSLWKKYQIPFLVLEPAKQEYRALANQKGMEDLRIFSPSANMLFPLHINPFEFPKGLILAEHIRQLVSVFEGAFPLDNPMPFLLDTAIEAVYRDLGWTPDTIYTEKTKLRFPTMSLLYQRLSEELDSTRYSDEVRGNLESALKVRIGSLLRREMGDVFDVPTSTIAPEEWLKIPAVIELESMGTGPANFLTLMLCTLIREALKVAPRHDNNHARHLIFIEEAHNLIGPKAEEVYGAEANPKQAATVFIVKMLAEVRALGEGIIVADQLPTVMAQEVIKNTGLKIGHRITAADDRGLLGSTMAANIRQLEEMSTYGQGRALMSYEGLMRPFTFQVHLWLGDWGTPNCTKDRFDLDWCENHCDYYKNGDCIPQAGKQRFYRQPKADKELAELLQSRPVYRTVCERSFEIECIRFNRHLSVLSDTVGKLLVQVKAVNEDYLRIRREEELVYELTETLMSQADWEENDELKSHIQNKADQVYRLKQEWERKHKLAQMFNQVYDTIVDCLTLFRNIEDRKKHWAELGINQFDGTDTKTSSSRPLTEAEAKVKGVKDMQTVASLLAQELFVIARLHLPNAEQIGREIRSLVAHFQTKSILF